MFPRWAMARVSADGEPAIWLIAHQDGISPAAGRGTTPEQEQVQVLDVMREGYPRGRARDLTAGVGPDQPPVTLRPAPLPSPARSGVQHVSGPDIVLRGGRVVDPESGRDEVSDVIISGGTITSVGNAPPGAPVDLDVSGLVVALLDSSTCTVMPRFSPDEGYKPGRRGDDRSRPRGRQVGPIKSADKNTAEEARAARRSGSAGFSASWAATRMRIVGGHPPPGRPWSLLAPFGYWPISTWRRRRRRLSLVLGTSGGSIRRRGDRHRPAHGLRAGHRPGQFLALAGSGG